jgi:DNA-binding transcriptional LysR family regulator
VALFVRDHSGVRLTQAGQRFLARARDALSQIGDARSDAASFGRGETGIVRIGIFSSMASGFLRELLRQFVERNPTVRPELVEGRHSEHVAAVMRDRLDIAFLTGEPDCRGCDRVYLWSERIYVAFQNSDPLAKQSEVTWHDLRDRRFVVSDYDFGPEIHNYLVKNLVELGRHPIIERHAVARDTLLGLVALGQGLALTTESSIATLLPNIVYRPLVGEVLPIRAFWSPRNDNPVLRRFLSQARSMSRSCAHAVAEQRDGLSSA